MSPVVTFKIILYINCTDETIKKSRNVLKIIDSQKKFRDCSTEALFTNVFGCRVLTGSKAFVGPLLSKNVRNKFHKKKMQ